MYTIIIMYILCASTYYRSQNSTVEPLNKGHVGDNLNSAVVSFVERLSSSRKFKMY